MNKLTGFSKTNFTCDSCGKEFQQEVAYSVAKN
jgi:transposase-like protein